MRNVLLAAVALLCGLAAAAPAAHASDPRLQDPGPPSAQAAGPSAQSAASELTGKLVLSWGKFNRANRPSARYLRRSKSMRKVIDAVNQRLALPEDFSVHISDQLEIGPAYFSFTLTDGRSSKMIHFPGSFLTQTTGIMARHMRALHPRRKPARRVREARRLMADANQFVLAHEVGHLIVDQLDIPVTGREEDAVDGFAAYLLANDQRFGPRTALAAALQFVGFTQDRGPVKMEDYADEHSVTMQRAYQFMCWVYGSDRKRYRGLIGRDGLPRTRARHCAAEWRQLNSSWSRLLAPHEVAA